MAVNGPPNSILQTFKTIGKGIYLYIPSEEKANGSETEAPDLIIVSTWMGANLRNVAKYTEYYQNTHPGCPILLLTSSGADFFFNSASKQRLRFATAVTAIRGYTESTDRPIKQGILVHAMSNGGTGQFAFLAKQYYETTGRSMPVKSITIDSAPGTTRIKPALSSFSKLFPNKWYIRLPVKAIFLVLVTVFYVIPEFFGHKSLAQVSRDIVNSEKPAYIPKEAKRLYIYSAADTEVSDLDVESHADEAESKGMSVVRARFEGSLHVQHMRHDPQRYWALVKQVWSSIA